MTFNIKKNFSARLELLGIGAANRQFRQNLEEALRQLAVDLPIEEVQDVDRLLKYDISGIPALVINGHVVFQKVVPSVEDLKIVLNVMLLAKEDNRLFGLKNILAPVDFSENSIHALRYAYQLARRTRGQLEIVHIFQPTIESKPTMQLAATVSDLREREMELDSLRTELRREYGRRIPIKTTLLNGPVKEEIYRLSHKLDVDLIVMGTTGEGGALGKWFGSTSSEVARHASCPVLLLPHALEFTPFKRIVYASDYHPEEAYVLPKVMELASAFRSDVYFAHINQKKHQEYSVSTTAVENWAGDSNLSLHCSTIECQDVVEGLNHYASEVNAQLLVMATSRRNLFQDLLHRSTTRKMVFNTEVPLLVLHFDD